jgi:DNA-binding CsgD family transcriptional regulator
MQRLLERDAALAELRALAHRLRDRGGRVVLLRGEAGVGKTAVIARWAAGLDASARVLRGWCDPLAAPRPLGPLVDTLAGLGDRQAAGLGAAVAAGDIAAIYARLLAVLAGGPQWVWVIEDAHWADGATLDLLRFMARRIGGLPLLLVVTYREDELGPQHPLTVALGDIATCEALTRINLAPLSREAVAVLATGSGINADRLHQLTGGNPFFVTEVLAAGPQGLNRDGLPRSIAEAVRGRLGRLSSRGRDTAQAVAVSGPRTPSTLLAKVCLAGASGLEECRGAGVLVTDGDAVGFRHELARRAALDQIPGYHRRLLHKRAAAALAEPPVDPDTLAALAFHADQAGDVDAVLQYSPAAAERAATLGAHGEAAELYGVMLRQRGASQEQRANWLERHAFESYLCGRAADSVSSWRNAIDLRNQLGHRLEEGDDLRWLSYLLVSLGGSAEATEAGLASLRVLETLGPTPQLAWSLVNMAELSTFAYHPTAAEYADRAIALGAQVGDDAVVLRGRAFAALDTIFRADIGWDRLEGTWRETMNNPALTEHVAYIGTLLCWSAATHHDLDRADRYLAETASFCDAHDLGMFRALVTSAGALAALYSGQWDRAVLSADQILTRPELSPLHRLLPLISLAVVRARRGQQPVAPLLDQAASYAMPDHLGRLALVRAARAEVAWLAGDDDTARTEAQAGLAAATENADPWLVGHLRRWVYLAGGPTETTSDHRLTPYELEINGDWQAAVDAWAERDCPYDAAIAQLGGDVAAVESALATFRTLGARAAARRAQQRLALLRPPKSNRRDTLADPNGLTRREREVLKLLTQGHSDADIAATLHISTKTVGAHVSSILTKLRVDNRTQAAAHTLKPRAI